MTRSIVMASDPGNIGNRMIQFLAAKKLALCLQAEKIENINLPEWGYEKSCLPDNYRKIISKVTSKTLLQPDFIDYLKYYFCDSTYKIYMEGYFQDMGWFPSLSQSRSLFKNQKSDYEEYITEKHLLINIRAGEILSGGYSFYVQIPIWYYKMIIDETGLIPVFCGQLDNEYYTSLLRESFPNAYFLPSKGIMSDFFLIRNAKNICISVSTFSWIAAWLSEAKNIFFPLTGFYHPTWQKSYHLSPCNLLPIYDFRYRFFNFPIYFNTDFQENLDHFNNIKGQVNEVSHSFVKKLIDSQESKNYNINDTCNIIIDEAYYTKSNKDCAWGISNLVYKDCLEHFVDVGIKNNRTPSPLPGLLIKTPFISSFSKTNQSSICSYSYGKTEIEDSSLLVNGKFYQKIFNHTEQEDNPWWWVDLGEIYNISHLKLLNRSFDHYEIQSRLIPFVIMISKNGSDFTEVFRVEAVEDQEQIEVIDLPLENCMGRYIKILLPGENRIIHLRQVLVYGNS